MAEDISYEIKEKLKQHGFINVEIKDDVDNIFKGKECLFARQYSKNRCNGGYIVGKKLESQGHQSETFHVSCQEDDKYVAKMVFYSFDLSIKEFFKEIENQIEISKFNLAPKIHEIWLCRDKAVFIMDLLVGSTVEKYAQQKRLNSAILKRIKSKIDSLHDRGWIHGDLHTRNVLVLDDGNIFFVDFNSSYQPSHIFLRDAKKADTDTFKNSLSDDGVPSKLISDVFEFDEPDFDEKDAVPPFFSSEPDPFKQIQIMSLRNATYGRDEVKRTFNIPSSSSMPGSIRRDKRRDDSDESDDSDKDNRRPIGKKLFVMPGSTRRNKRRDESDDSD